MRTQFIYSEKFDFWLILSVGIWSTLLAYGLNGILDLSQYSSLYWLLLVVGVDVAHVYSSLYRTYLNSDGRKEYSRLLIWIPVLCFAMSFLLAYAGAVYFWHFLVYVAVFHFIRQQAGFVRIYKKRHLSFDEIVIYIITAGSILAWHLSDNKAFQWFIKNDFLSFDFLSAMEKNQLLAGVQVLILLSFVAYLILQLKAYLQNKNSYEYQSALLVIATFTAWYFGIVTTESDFIFTFTNVLTHGIPYLALVWQTQKKQKTYFAEVSVFLFILVMLAFIEEGFWDSFVWREHSEYFSSFYFLPQAVSPVAQALALSVLILPQLTHYMLDAFIWKSKGHARAWTPEL